MPRSSAARQASRRMATAWSASGGHVVAFVAGEEIARHAAKDRRAELLGDLQMVDDDLGVGDAPCRSPPRPAVAVPSRPSGASAGSSPCRIRRRALSPRPRARIARQVVVAERLKGRELEQHAGQPQFGGQPEHADRIQPAVASADRSRCRVSWLASPLPSVRRRIPGDVTALRLPSVPLLPGDAAPGDDVLRPVGQGVVVFHDDFHDAAPGLLQRSRGVPCGCASASNSGTARAAGLGFSEKMYLSPRIGGHLLHVHPGRTGDAAQIVMPLDRRASGRAAARSSRSRSARNGP